MRKENLTYLEHLNTKRLMYKHKIKKTGIIMATGLMLLGLYSCDKQLVPMALNTNKVEYNKNKQQVVNEDLDKTYNEINANIQAIKLSVDTAIITMTEYEPVEKQMIDNKTFDAYVISGLNADSINKKLQGTYLDGMGDVMYDIEQNYGINFRFIYAIGCHESLYGKKPANTHNYFGIVSKRGYRGFVNKEQSLYYMANLLNHKTYKGKDITAIAKIYCPPDWKHWSNSVRYIMNEI